MKITKRLWPGAGGGSGGADGGGLRAEGTCIRRYRIRRCALWPCRRADAPCRADLHGRGQHGGYLALQVARPHAGGRLEWRKA